MQIAWDDSMQTGVPKVDEQHQELIKAINALADAMRNGQGKDEIGKILTFAGQYAQEHFRFEEGCFEEYHCPAAMKNKQEHAQFIETFTRRMTEFDEKGANFQFVMKIYRELSDWLLQHILKVDLQLRAYALKKT